MFFVNISEKENSIKLKFKKRPSLDDIKQTIWKRMQLERDTYNLMIAEDVIMSDEHLASIFVKEANQCHLNIIKHAALAHQAMPFAEEHEINPPLYITSDVLVYHPDEDVQSQVNSAQAKLQDNDEFMPAQLDDVHHDEAFQEQAPIQEKLIEVHHEHNDEVVQASVLQQKAVEVPEVVKASDKIDVLEQSNQPGLARHQAGMMNFLMHLWQWITNFFNQLLGRIEVEPTQSPSMSLR